MKTTPSIYASEHLTWDKDPTVTSIKTPFNIEAILRADPALHEAWKKEPFYIDLDETGFPIIRRLTAPSSAAA